MADLDPSTLFGVKGLVAVITGGGTGIGLMIAQALEANGAVVYILGRRQEVLEKAAKTAKHGNIHYFKADVTSKSDLLAAVDHIASKSGYVNLVVANSGITGPTLRTLDKNASLTEFRDHLWNWDMEEFNQTFALNTTAAFFTVVAFLELLDKGNKAGNLQQKSQVICIASAGAFNRVPMAGYAYAGSKSAAVHIMKQLATNLVPYDIRSNVIAPGLFPSEMTEGILKQETWPRDFIPEQRAGNIKDMAGAILFLTSRAGSYINGNVLLTDGGRLSLLPATY
ncbi:FabG Dehydrogenase with different specificities related to short-chain alcohol dehydrogenase [Pyrenophora tritici-repentis]|uniref:FabG, Dehydrogenase with different specificities (Related to short-chain alcohol dehydrogenase) n=2 Tax=Pyrenophora tritici-repentis TaxID=45151 RepID=A0A2W1DDF6_9PLEO|nr:short chain dehydrogenase/reductase [Pyrenophora tritici-repentis Pt-1C-BFP]KAA8621488.1 Short chain dehydrogenase/reductase [Pyrenophora tritici-repentis]EDU51554.1 short chain dehydrogenase/reductase [Pyrenophora tritici-repentis Pt-1C-BFP]KAF7450730.1 Short chain dehydrogenase/reductase [Pyrenophora tritici-repentis]KAF7573371.1 FabG, Dehydrogenase with different specificities (related to short-chain alcohol dehydrogenase) [Pyrenophora tritici-repentis]KAG9381055.1 Short chain dehydrogen